MSHFKEKHKEYLVKNGIKTEDELVIYLDILRNTRNSPKEDRQMLMDFAWLMINEKSSVSSFFAENLKTPSKEFYNYFDKFKTEDEKIRVNFYKYVENGVIMEVKQFLSLESAKNFFNKSDFTEAFYYTYATNELIEKEEKSKNSPTFMDEVLDSNTTTTEVPNFNITDIKQILPKHIFDTIEKQEDKKEGFNSSDHYLADEIGYFKQCGKKEMGVKLDSEKPKIALLFKQFPKALEAIARCSEYGHEKYKDTDLDYLNFKRVKEGSDAYANAGLRHRLQKGIDLESMLPHCYHVAWNALAELELLLEDK